MKLKELFRLVNPVWLWLTMKKYLKTFVSFRTDPNREILLRPLFIFAEKIGILIMHEQDGGRRNIQSVYVFAIYSSLTILIGCHLYNTITRSVRYLPELLQAIVEDLYIGVLTYMSNYFRIHYGQLDSLMIILERMNRYSDAKVSQTCQKQSKLVLILLAIPVSIIGTNTALEALLPLSPDNLNIQRTVYNTTHPERRLPLHVRIPFVDETESWTYEILFLIQTYLLFLLFSMYNTVFSILPIILFYIQGQYKILSNYIEKVGQDHRDSHGDSIEYTNIETNHFHRVEKGKSKNVKLDFRNVVKMSVESKKQYEKTYIKQIVQYQQKLIMMHDKVRNNTRKHQANHTISAETDYDA
uniref:Odorant receptor n=1 Tax=Cacopsylla melanoneura TaxID=428564 RepID=A0A8D8QP63_9HEMI